MFDKALIAAANHQPAKQQRDTNSACTFLTRSFGCFLVLFSNHVTEGWSQQWTLITWHFVQRGRRGAAPPQGREGWCPGHPPPAQHLPRARWPHPGLGGFCCQPPAAPGPDPLQHQQLQEKCMDIVAAHSACHKQRGKISSQTSKHSLDTVSDFQRIKLTAPFSPLIKNRQTNPHKPSLK